jgi:MerR family transcriptional regulator, light-induced transcriptional regulator
MYHFTIRDVENLSGIKAHTLRMWEQRHGLCVCKRKESQHRYYDNEDLKYILRIAYLYHNGYRISRIAALSPEELNRLASKRFNNDEYEVLVNQLIEACLEYDQLAFEKLLRNSLSTMGMEKCMEKVVHPFMDKIGLLWMTGHVLPAQEHFCSHLIQKLIITAVNALPQAPPGAARLLLFTPKGEMHELSLLVAQYLFRKKQVRCIMMGRDISIEELQYTAAHTGATHLYFHLITNFTNCNTTVYLQKLEKAFPNLRIIASGPALKDTASVPANTTLLYSFQEVIRYELLR